MSLTRAHTKLIRIRTNLLNRKSDLMPNPNAWTTKLTIFLASSLTVMAGATVSPSLPAMKQNFASTITDPDLLTTLVKLVITLPALFITIGSPIAGLIIDRFGRKPLLLVATILYGLAGTSGLYLESLPAILVGRAFLGLAVAGVMVSATTLIADYYSGPARAAFMGLQAGFMGLGGVLFLTLGGALAQQNWHYPFGIYLFAWAIVPLIMAFILEPDRARSLDPREIEESEAQSSSLPVAVLAIVYGLTTLSQIAFYLIPVQLPFFLETLVRAQPSQSGLAIALCTLFSALASVTYGKLKQRMEFITFLPIIFGLMGIGYLLIGQSTNWLQVLTGLAIAGMGLGILMPNMTVWLSTTVPDAVRGRALGGLSTAMFLGQFLSPIVTQPFTKPLGFGGVYALTGGILIVVALAFAVFKSQVRNLTRSQAI
ncbi:MFS transporter [Chamaesiphon minutus]|uniref:Arabinose efflux permease family protein n=1 Tax=Chamaesiphon minutus (strain ATCC 27169 / PCC 6605) TaxID=1173020 RepID=K9UAI3_CHAP6|nr:MFS transporter [Chamaesiphon minutus]AFY91825.1 arabinose efflux permease family protein [Chamaesiphon minutus PCC 6605]